MTQALNATGLAKRYEGADRPAVQDVDLAVGANEIVALVGPSGCGKTTILRMIAGLEPMGAGRIEIGGTTVADGRQLVPTEKRGIALVFQEHALFPHLDVAKNVAFGMRAHHVPDVEAKTTEMLELVGLDALASRDPDQLSGGEQQRVAVARALAVKPTLLLLDEPFNSLDAGLRTSVRRDIRRLIKETDTSALLVTHDQEEAMSMADRIVVVRKGAVQQVGTPEDVYANPRTPFVARFVSRANVFEVVARGHTAESPLGEVQILGEERDGPLTIAVRPEGGRIAKDGVSGKVIDREYLGASVTLTVDIGLSVRLRVEPTDRVRVGDKVALAVDGPVIQLED